MRDRRLCRRSIEHFQSENALESGHKKGKNRSFCLYALFIERDFFVYLAKSFGGSALPCYPLVVQSTSGSLKRVIAQNRHSLRSELIHSCSDKDFKLLACALISRKPGESLVIKTLYCDVASLKLRSIAKADMVTGVVRITSDNQ